jgi:Lrp/AsnC family leucine-responsive transcriptional regulator
MNLDGKDLEIVKTLLRGAATPKSEVARRLRIAPSVVSDRVRRLERSGVIRRYETRLDPRQLGYPLLAFVFVTERKPTGGVDLGAELSLVTGVEEVHKIAGDDCFLVKIRARDPEALARILDGEIASVATVAATRTTIVLSTVKEDVALGGIEELAEART